MGGWNSTLQAAWYVRQAHWARLCYIPFVIWCLWTTSTIWLLILASTSFMVGRVRAKENWKTSASCEYDRWMVETQLCKLRDTSDTFVGHLHLFVFRDNYEWAYVHSLCAYHVVRRPWDLFIRLRLVIPGTGTNLARLHPRTLLPARGTFFLNVGFWLRKYTAFLRVRTRYPHMVGIWEELDAPEHTEAWWVRDFRILSRRSP